VLREKVVGEKEEGPHLAAVSCRGILCQIGVEPCTLDLGKRGIGSKSHSEKKTSQELADGRYSLVNPLKFVFQQIVSDVSA
jgi:hypothetical protein